jgi:O-antigen ligase
MAGQLIGFLLAMYFLVGRWTFARLESDEQFVSMIEQPRFWLVIVLIVATVVVQDGIPRRARQFHPSSVDWAVIVFLSYMLLTAAWGPDAELAASKAGELALMLAVAMVIALNRCGRIDDELHAGYWFTIVAVGIALGGSALFHASDARAYTPGGGPNTFSRNMGLMAFGALFLAARYGILMRISSIGIFATATLLVLHSGSRGGLLSFSVASVIYAVTASTGILKRISIISVMSAATLLVLFYTQAGQQAMDIFSGRIIEKTVENRHLSGRDELWTQSLEMIQERPLFGWGLNGFRANSWNYPHNIFLEVAVEGGMIGLVLALNVGRAWWKAVVRQRRGYLLRTDLAALALTFTAAQTSGDLFDSRGVFLALALSIPLTRVVQRQSPRRRTPRLIAHRRATVVAPARIGLIQHKNDNHRRVTA